MNKILVLCSIFCSTTVLAKDTDCSELSKNCSKEKIQTVDWYEKHEAERKAMTKKCQNNPGELGETPTCKNVARANDNIYFKTPIKYNW
jgi:hypothetical protein